MPVTFPQKSLGVVPGHTFATDPEELVTPEKLNAILGAAQLNLSSGSAVPYGTTADWAALNLATYPNVSGWDTTVNAQLTVNAAGDKVGYSMPVFADTTSRDVFSAAIGSKLIEGQTVTVRATADAGVYAWESSAWVLKTAGASDLAAKANVGMGNVDAGSIPSSLLKTDSDADKIALSNLNDAVKALLGNGGEGYFNPQGGPPVDTTASMAAYTADESAWIAQQACGEITKISCVADVAGSLDGTYMRLDDEDGSVGLWIDVDNSGTSAPAGATALDRQLEVTGVATGDAAAAVATAVASAINGDSKFYAYAEGGNVVVVALNDAVTTAAVDGDTGFTPSSGGQYANLGRALWNGGTSGVFSDDFDIIAPSPFTLSDRQVTRTNLTLSADDDIAEVEAKTADITKGELYLPDGTKMCHGAIVTNESPPKLVWGVDVNGLQYVYNTKEASPVLAYVNGVAVRKAVLGADGSVISCELEDGRFWPIASAEYGSILQLLALLWLPGWGQSLETGADSTCLNSAAVFTGLALMLNTGIRDGMEAAVTASALTSFIDLVQSNSSPSKEAPSSGMANQLVSSLQTRAGINVKLLATHSAAGGSAYEDLKYGTTYFTNLETQLQAVNALCLAQTGRPFFCPALCTAHGEADTDEGTTATEYKNFMIELRRHFGKLVGDNAQQLFRPYLLMQQMCSWNVYSLTAPTCSLGQLQAMEADDLIRITHPAYIFEYQDGTLGTSKAHLTSEGYALMGEYRAKAIRRILMGEDPKPLYPTAVSRAANVITVTFNVPVAPLALDTSLVSDPGSYGFEYFDDGTPPAISSVAVNSDGVSVDITLASTPTGANKKIRYAYTGNILNDAGNQSGPRGCLRDSDPETSYYHANQASPTSTYYLRNYCVAFEKDVT